MSLGTALLMMLQAGQAPAAPPLSPAAVASAEQFTALLDQGRYADTWSAAGNVATTHTIQTAWTGGLTAARKPLGAVASRKLRSETPTRTLPGVPDGDYDIVQFDTDFAGKFRLATTSLTSSRIHAKLSSSSTARATISSRVFAEMLYAIAGSSYADTACFDSQTTTC